MLRPTVFAELAPAREALLGQMEAQLEAQREDFEARTGQAMESNGARAQPVSKNMPEVVSQIVLSRQLQDRVGEMLSAGEMLLHDLQGMPRFQSKAQELHAHLNDFGQQQFGEWVELVEAELRDEVRGRGRGRGRGRACRSPSP